MQQGIRDGVDLVDPTPREWPQQRRYIGVVAHAYRDEDLASRDARIGQEANFSPDPVTLAGVGREDNQSRVRLLKPLVDLGDDVIAGPDHPLIEPCVDSTFAQRPGKRLDGGLVFRRMANEN